MSLLLFKQKEIVAENVLQGTGGFEWGQYGITASMLSPPTTPYCGDTEAQSGETNPILEGLDPYFSAVVSKFAGSNITGIEIEVSAANDSTFTQPKSWTSGVIAISMAAAGRTADVNYGGT
jgi:hypothetical protein